MKLSDYVLSLLCSNGARHVFLVPGGAAMHLNDSLGKSSCLAYTATLHEQAAAIAAEAWAKTTNELGVCMTTAGPGATNAITGVAGAWLDSSPVVFLSGQVKTADLKQGTGLRMLGVQEIDIVSLVSPITKYAVTVTEASTIRYHVEKAIYLAKAPRRGPVWLDLPLDVQAASIDPDQLPGFVPETPAGGLAGQIESYAERVAELLHSAERPVLVAGNGIRLAGALEDFRRLVEVAQVPVLTTWLGLDLLPQAHPLFAGRPGSVAPRGANFALQNSDLMIAIGARLDMAFTAYAHNRLARAARKVICDVDEAEIAKLRIAIDVPVVADAGEFIRALLAKLSTRAYQVPSAWRERVSSWKQQYPVVLMEHLERCDFVSTYAFSKLLSDELAEGDLICPTSSGAAIEIFLLAFEVKDRQRVFHNRGTGAMGFALPSAIAACLASDGHRTVCVDGDGGLQFNVQELETLRRLNLNVKLFVLNNQGYSSIRTSQSRYFGRYVASDPHSGMTLPDTIAVASAYGLRATRIIGGEDIRARLREVLDRPGPEVIDVLVPPNELRQPSVVSVQRTDGSMASKPLEDLWPFLDREEFRQNMIIPVLED